MDYSKYSDSTLINQYVERRDMGALDELERRGKLHQVDKVAVATQLNALETRDHRIGQLNSLLPSCKLFLAAVCLLALAGCGSSFGGLHEVLDGGGVEQPPAEVVKVPRDYWPENKCRACSNQ